MSKSLEKLRKKLIMDNIPANKFSNPKSYNKNEFYLDEIMDKKFKKNDFLKNLIKNCSENNCYNMLIFIKAVLIFPKILKF